MWAPKLPLHSRLLAATPWGNEQKVTAIHHLKIKAMLGMLGGGENMSENLNGCLFTFGISLDQGIGEGGQTELISVRGGRLPVGVPAKAPAHRLLN